ITVSPSGTSVSCSTKIAPRSRSCSTTCLLWTISLRTYTGGPYSSSARSTVCTARSTPAQYPRGAASRSFSGKAVMLGSEASEQPEHGLSHGVEAALGDHRQVVAPAVEAFELEVDQVDRRDAPAQEGDVVVTDRRASRVREHRPRPYSAGRGAQPFPEPLARVRLARDPQPPLADEVEQHHRARVPEAARRDLAAPQAVGEEVGRAARALLAVEQDEVDRVARPLDRAGELGHDGGARGAVVGADEAADVLRVVVGAHHHVAGLASPHGPDDVAQAARHLLEATAREQAPQAARQPPRGLGARGPRPQLDLVLEQLPGGAGVEAVDLEAGGAAVVAVGKT